MRGRHVYLSGRDIETILTSLHFSEERITEWHAREGRPEWRDSSLQPINDVKEKLRRQPKENA